MARREGIEVRIAAATVLAAAALALPAVAVAGNGSFPRQAPGSPFEVGGGSEQPAVGDFNNDRRQDLAAASFFDDDVTVLLGRARGRFQAAPDSPVGVGANANAVVVADFDEDGNEDLAVATDAGLVIRLGAGTGRFPTTTPGSPIVSAYARKLAVGDFNADGHHDLAGTTGAQLWIRLGDGEGLFAQPVGSPYPAVGSSGLAVADLDGDGDDDIGVSADPSNGALPGQLLIRLGAGDGTFAAVASGSPFQTFPAPRGIVAGDFDRDGDEDLAIACYVGGETGATAVHLGSGDGRFATTPTPLFASDTAPWNLAVGDFRSDGNLDLAIANTSSTRAAASVWLGSRQGAFAAAAGSPFRWGDDGRGVAVGDFDQDRIQDLALMDGGLGVVVRLGGGRPADAGNLLRNGGAEGSGPARLVGASPPIAGWGRKGRFTAVRYGSPGDFPSRFLANRVIGQEAFFSGGPGAASSSATQRLRVGRRAWGGTARLSAYLGGRRADGDAMRVAAVFRNRKGKALARLRIGPVTPADRGQRTVLLPQAATRKVPRGTRSIAVTIRAIHAQGAYTDAYADRISLTIKPKKKKRKKGKR